MNFNEIQNFILLEYSCDIQLNEVRNVIFELIREDKVNEVGNNSFVLSQETSRLLQEKINSSNALEEEVISEWAQEISDRYSVEESDLRILCDSLLSFCNTLFYNHGAESKNLLSDKFNENVSIEDNIEKLIESLNLKSRKLYDIAQKEFKAFLSSKKANVVNYLLFLINRAVGYLTEVCDPNTIDVLRSNMSIKTIYLDTNVVFRLIDLQGEQRKASTLEVIDLCREFGIEIKITDKTLQQLQNTINHFAQLLLKNPLPSHISRIAYQFRNSDNYLSIYWRESSLNENLKVSDFNARYKHIDLFLSELGIEVENTTDIEDNLITLKQEIGSKFFMFLSDHSITTRNDSSVDHDAFHLALIYKKQSAPVNRFIDASTFFLTSDRILDYFQDKLHILKHSKAPLTLRPSNIINILQFIKPNGKDYSSVFLDIFTRSSYIPMKINNEVIHDIASKLINLKHHPTIFEKILSDEHFQDKYNSSTTEEEKNSLLSNAIDEEIEKLVVDLTESQEQTKELEQKLEELVIREQDINSLLTKAKQQMGAAQEQLDKTLNDLSQSSKKESELSEIVNALKRKVDGHTRNWNIFFSVLLVIILFGFIIVDWYVLDDRIDAVLRYLSGVLLIAISAIIYYVFLFRKHTAWIIGIAISLFAIYFSL